MKRYVTALATAAVLGLSVAPAANAQTMDMEFNMLTGAVFNALRAMDLPTDNIDQLTLSEIAQIKFLLDGDESEGDKRRRIGVIVNK